MKKLITIQSELKAPKNQYNSFGKYKYRSCEDILEALKPLLKKNDCTLTISDEVKEAGGLVYVESKAIFSDAKESVEVTAQAGINPNKKGMDISQSFGSSSSYSRKYALNGLFLIDDTKDSDTEDNTVTVKDVNKKEPTKKSTPITKKEPTDDLDISFALGDLNKALNLKELRDCYLGLDKAVQNNPKVIAKKDDMKKLLTPEAK